MSLTMCMCVCVCVFVWVCAVKSRCFSSFHPLLLQVCRNKEAPVVAERAEENGVRTADSNLLASRH